MPDSVTEARALVAQAVAQKVDIVKTRVDDNLHGSGGSPKRLSPDVYAAIIEQAHQHGLRVVVHLYYLADAKAVIKAGANFIAHSIRELDVDQELVDAMKAKDVCLSPTLTRDLTNFAYESTPKWFEDTLFLRHADAAILQQLRDPKQQTSVAADPFNARYKLALQRAMHNLKLLSDGGVRIASELIVGLKILVSKATSNGWKWKRWRLPVSLPSAS